MVDYDINQNLKAERTSWGSFKTVSGFKEFEQELFFKIFAKERELLGSGGNFKTQKEKLRLIINRTAKEFDIIDEVKNINIRRAIGKEGTYRINIVYYTNREFSEIF